VLITRRSFFAWLFQVLPQPPRGLQVLPTLTCPLGHSTPAFESSFSARTHICTVCGVYFHVLPVTP
jgi:hypothetical protein